MFFIGIGLFTLSLVRGGAPPIWIKSSNITGNNRMDCAVPLIVIDAGHGGIDGGAIGVNGVVERVGC